MPTELYGLLIQIPLVGVFIWYAMAMTKQQREATVNDQTRMLEHEKGLQATTHAFIESQNERWQEILSVERTRRKEAMDQGLREVETIAKAITGLADALSMQAETISRHDAAALERFNAIISEVRNGK